MADETTVGTEKSDATEKPRAPRKVREGTAVSASMDKTVVVEVRDAAAHSTYSKIVRRNKKLKAHDENNECGIGDKVMIMETRPLSKDKRWRLIRIIEKAK